MSHPALTQLRALRYFAAMPPLEPQLRDWLLLEDSMTKRFEQQGKRSGVIRLTKVCRPEALVGEGRCCRTKRATGCGKSYFAPMVNPAGRWCRSRRCAARSWRCSSWGRRRWGVSVHVIDVNPRFY
jgi:hypothetical protein